ncbi:GNAT family N-acetyltransferase [Microvirga arsenatis]|uniref:GNAT family N-acetyltransferase n=1 Tax=Microvirga arsenatis TaxID=2692265 RepID=A0ABW9Z4K0_9HYPH|nr:GNAT family N-acetyltransferase [Microvirga arsenatis]NBJ27017.1 GNAT family N-acetyltransferase [Microvirga arsenatis]
MTELRFSPCTIRPGELTQYANLLRACFPKSHDRYTDRYLSWLYLENPDGPVVGFDAWDGDSLAAHYACIPIRAHLAGGEAKVLLSLNTATHPSYQGRGLFTKLARLTYERAAESGYLAVIGVANANSTPGFLTKLSFQHVASLKALIGFGPLRVTPEIVQNRSSDFVRLWSPQALAWRLANPFRPVRVAAAKPGLVAFGASTGIPGFTAWSERPVDASWNIKAKPSLTATGARVFLGLLPEGERHSSFFWNIPARLRPAPLNFIYRPLRETAPKKIVAERIFFDFLDFDAF